MQRKVLLQPSKDGSNLRVSVTGEGAEIFHGTITKVDGLWRRAQFTDQDGRIIANGLGEIHYAIHSITGIFPALVLEIHPGYFAMYAGEDFPIARALLLDGEYCYRCFAVHESARMRTLADATQHAFWGVA